MKRWLRERASGIPHTHTHAVYINSQKLAKSERMVSKKCANTTEYIERDSRKPHTHTHKREEEDKLSDAAVRRKREEVERRRLKVASLSLAGCCCCATRDVFRWTGC